MRTKKLGKSLRKEFPIFKSLSSPGSSRGSTLHYLDSAASAQKPKAVIEAQSHYLENDYANVHRGAYLLSARSTALYEDSRMQVASFLEQRGPCSRGKVSIKPHQVVFTRGTTDGINILA